jgi:hypothetical protein
VKIAETHKSDPVAAIEILDTIISTQPLKTKLLRKSREQLLEVWKSMSNVQVSKLIVVFVLLASANCSCPVCCRCCC